mgnify:CR=1 FL=1
MSDSTPPLTRDERMWCGARDDCTFEMIMGMAVFGATGGNPSGSRPNFFGRQHLTFDKGGKCDGAKQGIVRKISLMVGMGAITTIVGSA